MPVDAAVFGPTTLSLTQAVGSFNMFLPKLSDIRKAHPTTDPSFTADVRTGEVAAVALTVGIGAIVSSLTGSPVPTVVAVVASLGLVALYETTLRSNAPATQEGKIA